MEVLMKNRILLFEIIALATMLAFSLVFLSCGDSSDPTSPDGGDDTGWDGVTIDTSWYTDVIGDDPDAEVDEFMISTTEQLAALAAIVNGTWGGTPDSFEGKTITQTADLSLGGKQWTPIGTDDNPFMGRYEGSSMTISGLKITNIGPSGVNLGMFGFIHAYGKVLGIKLLGVSITGYNSTGAVVGYNYGTVQECSVTGSVEGHLSVGCVAGYNIGTVQSCSVNGSVTSFGAGGGIGGVVGANGYIGVVDLCTFSGTVSGSYETGGIAGQNSGGTVTGSHFTSGAVSGSEDYVGGVVGRSYGANATVSGCSFSGSSVTGSGNYVGGVVGGANDNIDALVELCSATGSITGVEYVGGVVGFSFSMVGSCTFSGNVKGASCVGGIVGDNTASTVKDCSATGSGVTGIDYVGGVVGRNSGTKATVFGCSFSGSSVIGSGNYVGGVVGYSSGVAGTIATFATITNCYAASAVKATADDGYAGGIVGIQETSTTRVQYCYATGSVEGYYAGGICADNKGRITNSVALNTSVTGTNARRVADGGTLTNNYGSDGMLINGATISSGELGSANGKDVTAALYNTQAWWTTNANWSDGGWYFGVSGAWAWDSTLNLPVLK